MYIDDNQDLWLQLEATGAGGQALAKKLSARVPRHLRPGTFLSTAVWPNPKVVRVDLVYLKCSY